MINIQDNIKIIRAFFIWVLLNPPTTNPPTTDQPTNFKDLINKEYSFYRTQTQLGWCKTIVRSIIYLMNKYLYKIFIYLHKIFILSFLQKKTTCLWKTDKDVITFIFWHFKPNCFTPSQIFTVYFYVMKFQQDQMFFNIVPFCMWT